MNLIYTVELKDWNNPDSYPTLYIGQSLTTALIHFKNAHLSGKDAILYAEDVNGNTLDTLTSYDNFNINDLFTPENTELKRQYREATQEKEIYHNLYTEQLNKTDKLKRELERLQIENRQLKNKSLQPA